MIWTNYLVVCILSIAASPLLPPPVRHALTTPKNDLFYPYILLLYFRCIFFYYYYYHHYIVTYSHSTARNIIYNNSVLRAFEWIYLRRNSTKDCFVYRYKRRIIIVWHRCMYILSSPTKYPIHLNIFIIYCKTYNISL